MKTYNVKKRKYRAKKKPVLKRRWFWDLLLIFILLIGSSYLIFFSHLFELKCFDVQGVENGLEKKITIIMSDYAGKNILFINKDKIINEIKLNPRVKEVSIKKRIPSKMIIDIRLKEPVLTWCNTDCLLLDEDLTVTEGEMRDQYLKVFSDTKPDNLLEIQNIENNINNLEIQIQYVEIEDGSIEVKTIDGWSLYIEKGGDQKIIFTKLKLLFEQEISPEMIGRLEYIDLRFSKAYYKLSPTTPLEEQEHSDTNN